MFGLGPGEIAGVLVAVLLLFGAKRLPELARGLGRGITEFRKAIHPSVSVDSDRREDRDSPQ